MLLKEKLKMLRKEKGLTQEQMAERLNVSRQAITKWETAEGVPDVENLKQISILFNVSIDELVKQDIELEIKENAKYSFTKEIEIEHSKHFDINICKIQELNFVKNSEEKVKIEIFSDINENIENDFSVDFDDLYNRLDIDITTNKKETKSTDVKVFIYLPQKYIDEIEIKTEVKTINISELELTKFEFDGSMKYLNVNKTKGNIVLNASKCDVEAFYDKFEGSLEVNIINSTARVQIPKETEYRTILKGIKNKFVNENVKQDAKNSIELNGINSKLIII